jgi:hypothetical protein
MGGSRARALNLRALGYPVADTFAVEDSGGFRKLIVWLEDTKVGAGPNPRHQSWFLAAVWR